MPPSILIVFDENIARVRNLLSFLPNRGRGGRRNVQEADLLRASVVFLHAELEEFLRSLMIWRASSYDAEQLKNYNFYDGTKAGLEKVKLSFLAGHRGKTVDDFITENVTKYLDEFHTFNDVGGVKRALKESGIPPEEVESFNFLSLPAMIKRRHSIVHKADRNIERGGRGQQAANAISVNTVNKYIRSVLLLKEFVERHINP